MKSVTAEIQRHLGSVLLIAAAMKDVTRKVSALRTVHGGATSTSYAMCPDASHRQTFRTTVYSASSIPAEAPTVPTSPRRTTSARSISDVITKGVANHDIGPTPVSTTQKHRHCVRDISRNNLDVRDQIAGDRRKATKDGFVLSMSVRLEGVRRTEAAPEARTATCVRSLTHYVS